jgi:hypothetical protein
LLQAIEREPAHYFRNMLVEPLVSHREEKQKLLDCSGNSGWTIAARL